MLVDKKLVQETVKAVLHDGVSVGDILEIAPGTFRSTAKGITRVNWSDIDRMLMIADAERRNFTDEEVEKLLVQLEEFQKVLQEIHKK